MDQEKKAQGKTAIEVANKWATDFAEAYRSHEAWRVAALFAEDVDRLHVCGDQVIGAEHMRAEIEAFYEKLFAERPNISEDLEIESARFLSPELMLIDGTWILQGYHGGQPPSGRFVVINKHKAGMWSVVSSRILLPSSFLTEVGE